MLPYNCRKSSGFRISKAFVGALIFVWTFAAQAQGGQVIRFGVDPTFPPYESVNAQGGLVGIDIEIGESICQHLGATCEWVTINFSGAIPALNAKKVDAILSGMTITKKRKKQVLFSTPLYISPSRLMAPKAVTLDTTAASLKGKRVGIVQGSIQAAYANEYWKGKGVSLVLYQNDALARKDLMLGRVDATLQDVAAAQAFFETDNGKNFHLTGSPVYDPDIFGEGVAIGMRLNDSKLKEQIDAAIAEMKKGGSFQSILDDYAEYGLIAPKGE